MADSSLCSPASSQGSEEDGAILFGCRNAEEWLALAERTGNVTVLSPEDFDAFLAMLEEPPGPVTEELLRAHPPLSIKDEG